MANAQTHAQRLLEHGGDACSQCGREDYVANFLVKNGEFYCDDCASEIGLTEENQDEECR